MSTLDVWQTIKNDEFYSQFLEKGSGDIKAEALASGLSVAEQLKKLTEGIVLLDKEIQKQVLENHEDLLSQATWIEKLEVVLSTMQSHVQCLLSGVERLRTRIIEPFNKVEMQTVMLSNLHATSDLLRRVSRIQQLSKRLNTHMRSGPGGTIDLTKASQNLCELGLVMEDVDLSGLEVMEEDLGTIRSHRNDVERQGRLLLLQGLLNQNQRSINLALLVFCDLGILRSVVEHVMEGAKQRLSQCIRLALDSQSLSQIVNAGVTKAKGAPGKAIIRPPVSPSLTRHRVWGVLENLFENSIYSECCQVEILQRVLYKRTRHPQWVPLTQSAYFTDLLPKELKNFSFTFQKAASTMLAHELVEASKRSAYLKEALEGDYPRLLHVFMELCKKLRAISKKTVQGRGFMHDKEIDLEVSSGLSTEVVTPFENAYLSRSVSRLLDPVNLMFSGEAVPSPDEVDSLTRIITSELSVSMADRSLSRKVAKNINKTVRLFCLKCEQLVDTGGEATQVIDFCTSAQLQNIDIANLLHYFNYKVDRVLWNIRIPLSAESASIIQTALDKTDSFIEAIVNPIVTSIIASIEAIILTMHNEDYSMGSGTDESGMNPREKVPEVPCSLYMKELYGFISRSFKTYLKPFENQIVVSKCCVPLVCRSLELFIRHVCLVRPLGNGGRVKIVADFAQLEIALAPFYKVSVEMGPFYKTFRCLRTLLFCTPEEVLNCTALGKVMPYSLALMLLFARGPPELPSPHASANWSVSRFSQWLDAHPSERVRLEMMSGALQKYQRIVKHTGKKEFHSVYPIMVKLLEQGLEFNKK